MSALRSITIVFICLVALLITNCSESLTKPVQEKKIETITTEDFILHLPEDHESLLILFPCYPCDAINTLEEWKTLQVLIDQNVAVLAMNFNYHLWLEETEKETLAELLERAVSNYNLDTDHAVLGGFSSGGNVALLMTDYLHETEADLLPTGVFIVDSPIDLTALYKVTEKVIDRDQHEDAVQEALWIRSDFESRWGKGEELQKALKRLSPYSSESRNLNNLSHLEKVSVRLFTEPDTTWWKSNRGAEFNELNSYYIKLLAEDLANKYSEERIELIETQNSGYRSNGDRHPHSWTIVDEKKIIKLLKK